MICLNYTKLDIRETLLERIIYSCKYKRILRNSIYPPDFNINLTFEG